MALPATRVELSEIVTMVLGNMAFLVEDDCAARPDPKAVWLECAVSYSGPVSGSVTCCCTTRFAQQLTANLLGQAEDDPSAAAWSEDALREFMNVVCGQLVTAWHGSEAVFNLSIPTVTQRKAALPAVASSPGVCQLSVQGQPLICLAT